MASKNDIENFVKKEKLFGVFVVIIGLLIIIAESSHRMATGKVLLDLRIVLELELIVIFFVLIQIFLVPRIYPKEYKEYLRQVKKNHSSDDLKSYKRTIRNFLGVYLFITIIVLPLQIYDNEINIEFSLLLLGGFVLLSLALYIAKSIEEVKQDTN